MSRRQVKCALTSEDSRCLLFCITSTFVWLPLELVFGNNFKHNSLREASLNVYMSHHMSSDHVTPVYTKTTTAEAVILLVLYYYQSNVPYCILYFWINMAAAFMCLLHMFMAELILATSYSVWYFNLQQCILFVSTKSTFSEKTALFSVLWGLYSANPRGFSNCLFSWRSRRIFTTYKGFHILSRYDYHQNWRLWKLWIRIGNW